MAKKAVEKTPVQIAAEKAKATLDTARAADEKASTDKTQKAVADAEAAWKTAVTAENRERFVRVAGGRHKKAKISIRNLANVGNLRSYNYGEADVARLESSLALELKATLTKLRNALTKTTGASKEPEEDIFAV